MRAALAALLMLLPAASAHDRWHDDTPVPEWVKSFCCGPADAHHYKFDEVIVTPEGYKLPDYPTPIPSSPEHVFTSQDGEYWAFFKKFSGGNWSEVYCLFVPPGSM